MRAWRALRAMAARRIPEPTRQQILRVRRVQSFFSPLRHETFSYCGIEHAYFIHGYNVTWRNERSIEVPIALDFVRQPGRGLEVGNVLSHYTRVRWEIVDKFERAPGVRNVDILDYAPTGKFDFIVSVSTIEHVGRDEDPGDGSTAPIAVERMLDMLKPGGRMILTAPTGYNPALDAAVAYRRLRPVAQTTFVRNGVRWEPTPDIVVLPYEPRHVNAVWIGEFRRDG